MLNGKNYYMPAEWEQHERTLMEWPVKASLVWPEDYDKVCAGYAEAAKAISGFEKVTMIVNADTAEEAEALCGDGIEYLTVPHNDAWCRDNGPTFLVNKEKRLSAVNWQFNAWGGKYLPYDLDNEVAARVLKHFQIRYLDAPIIVEGGSIHVDGEGTLLTTQECLLNKNRNPHLSKEQIEEEIKSRLDISRVIWLNRGLFGDETDGHVDNVACFARPGVVLMQTCYEPGDPNCEITKENMEILRNSTDAAGRTPEIIEIPQPPVRYYHGVRLTLSYLNFYIVNGGIILPVFGGNAESGDKNAAEIIRKVFPERRVTTVDGMALITEGGNVHCITQQMPKGIR
jgi:agmatine deiminase